MRFGCFITRSAEEYFDGGSRGEWTDYDRQTWAEVSEVKSNVERLLDTFHFRDAQARR